MGAGEQLNRETGGLRFLLPTFILKGGFTKRDKVGLDLSDFRIRKTDAGSGDQISNNPS